MIQQTPLKAVMSYAMRANRDAVLMPRPRVHHGLVKEMINTVNKCLGIEEEKYSTLNVFDGPSFPSQTEIVMTHRLGISSFATTEISIVEALRSLKINSLLISQSSSLMKQSKEPAKDAEKLFGCLTSEDLATKFEKLEEKYFIQLQSMEQDYQNAMAFAEAIRKKYCDASIPERTLKLSIVSSYLLQNYQELKQTQKEYESKAEELKKFMTASGAEFPKIAVIVGTHLMGAVCGQFEIKKSVQLVPTCETQQSNIWPVVYSAVYMKTMKPVLLLDRVLTGEVNLPEGTPAVPIRLLCLAGVERVIVVSDVTSVDRLLKSGDLCLINGHASLFANNPLVGPNIEKWGTRFPDVSKIYKKGKTKQILTMLEKKMSVRNVKALWVPTVKGYHDAAEKKLAREALPFEVVAHKGLAEGVIVHHMSRDNIKEFMFLGVVARKQNDPFTLVANTWATLAKFFADGFDLMLAQALTMNFTFIV
eukprot:TRINITY_DN3096_c3_g1_i1.p1 TRINITY_DN3096_c3_g1~~TRINITY_DN3096_c3_g1_i1.p1  ORF type:complete len:477 (-),score=44.01 TRINITY_DN3096_c3_g1_i1:788-2218(-)